jgi:hypothetical protein
MNHPIYAFTLKRAGALIIILFMILTNSHVSGQQMDGLENSDWPPENHQADRWYFGNCAGLDFRSQDPVADLTNSNMNVPTSPAIMADSLGNILFYTNGVHVFDHAGQLMANGNGLHGFVGYTMPVLIVPKPGDNRIYYIFTTHRPKMNPQDQGTIYGLEYNEVDMSLNGGLGDITVKNVELLPPEVSSKLSAVKHSNGVDYWVLAHRFNSSEFCAFRVTPDGVDTSGYVSSALGTVHLPPGQNNNAVSYMKFSPDGTKIALAIHGTDIYEIFDFDASTGVVSNVITSPPVFDEPYGLEFSSDSRYLYATTTSTSYPLPNYTPPSYLFQFDVYSGSAIFTDFDTIALDTSGSYFGGIQLGTDGKIYVSRSPYGNAAIGVIQNPKRPGRECNFTSNAIDLMGRTSRYGFPNFIQTFFKQPHFYVDENTRSDTTFFYLQNDSNIDSIYWDFADPGSNENSSNELYPSHVYSGTGTYTVQVTEYFGGLSFGPYYRPVNVIINAIDERERYLTETMLLYPNPGDGRICFQPAFPFKEASISISDITGQVVRDLGTFDDFEIGKGYFLDIHDLPAGVYLIRILANGGEVYSSKYLKVE